MHNSRTLIVGGGIAGLTLANFFEQKNWPYTLIEKVEEFKPVGAGILLALNAMSVYRDIGIDASLIAAGNPIQLMEIENAKGKILSGSDMRHFSQKYGIPSLAIHRSSLHQALVSQLKSGEILTGTTLTKINDRGNEVEVELSNGSSESYGQVIGADGIDSQLREHLFGKLERRYAGYTCWRLVMPHNFDWPRDRMVEIWGKGKRLGIVPIDGDRIYAFSCLNTAAQNPKMKDLGLEAWKRLFSDIGPSGQKLIRALPADTHLIWNDLEDLQIPNWYKGNICLMGDAAHPVTPNMGQGAGMAIEDAWVLGKALETTSSPAEAFALFQEKRYKRVKWVLDNSYRTGAMAQWENGMACSLRNTLIRLTPRSVMQKMFEKRMTEVIW